MRCNSESQSELLSSVGRRSGSPINSPHESESETVDPSEKTEMHI